MKIISKYKDFYDFFTHDYEADIVYVREPVKVFENYENLYKDKSNSRNSRYISYKGECWIKNNEGNSWFTNYIFGIFPFVYSQPALNVCVKTITNYEEIITSTLSHSFVDEFSSLETTKEQEAYLYHYINKMINDYAINHPYTKIPKNITLPNISYSKTLINLLKRYIWKYECREIFMKLNDPIWIEANNMLISRSIYFEYGNENKIKCVGKSTKTPQYITNICFSKLNENILKYWYNDLMNLNTYINIENFLWSVKQEPVSIPDNKTKIISHGFDLKTSFRKM